MVQPSNLGPDHFLVTFAGTNHEYTVHMPLGKLLLDGTGNRHGMWSAVIQDAFGQRYRPGGSNPIEGSDGGSMINAGLRALSNHDTVSQWNWSTSYSEMQSNLDRSLNQLHLPVTASSDCVRLDLGFDALSEGHDWAVIGFQPNQQNPQQAMITIYNQASSGGVFGPGDTIPAGITDLGNGVIRMSLETFCSWRFQRLNYVRSRGPFGMLW